MSIALTPKCRYCKLLFSSNDNFCEGHEKNETCPFFVKEEKKKTFWKRVRIAWRFGDDSMDWLKESRRERAEENIKHWEQTKNERNSYYQKKIEEYTQELENFGNDLDLYPLSRKAAEVGIKRMEQERNDSNSYYQKMIEEQLKVIRDNQI